MAGMLYPAGVVASWGHVLVRRGKGLQLPVYEHTQRGTLIRWALGVSFVAFLLLRVFMDAPLSGPDAIVGLVLALIATALILMHSLTVSVDGEKVTAYMGPGIIRRSVALEDIRSIRRVKSPWYYGWGLRITAGGPLWRVSGFDAVALELPKSSWLIGTDDPGGLLAALERAGKEKRLQAG